MSTLIINMPFCAGCCSDQVPCSLFEGRTKGGVATLCGFSEYASPSTPPKKYRKQTLSGYHDACQYGTVPCAGVLDPRTHDAYSGTYTYNSTTCAETNNQLRTRSSDSPGSSCGSSTPGGTPGGTDVPAKDFTPVASGSTRTTTKTTDTFDYDTCEGGSNVKKLGQVVATLTEEDTEDDAWTRLNPAWSTWKTVGGTGCASTPPECVLAEWESRGAGDFTFSRTDAEYRATANVPNGEERTIIIEVWRRPYGSGGYTLFQEIEHTLTGGPGNTAQVTGTVPNERGYQTYVVCQSP